MGSVPGAFTVVVIAMGVLIAIDTDHAQLYLGVIGLLAVLGTILTFGALLHVTGSDASDRDRRDELCPRDDRPSDRDRRHRRTGWAGAPW